MKKRIIAILLSLALVLSVVAVAVFVGNRPDADKQQSKKENIPVVNAKPKDSAKVSLDSAIDIAFKDAGVNREDAVLVDQPSLDKDDQKPHYDIEFKYNDVEYDYEIAIDNGSVIKAEKEKEKDKIQSNEKVSEPVKVKEENNESVKPSSPAVENPNKEYISIENAKEIALNNAGVKQADAVFKKAYYDSDDLVAHFDIKFVANGYEYEYEIKASNGAILEKDVEKEPIREQVSQAPEKEIISKEKAKEIALNHAKVDSDKIKFVKIELDRDDLIAHYEVEFVEGNFEYDYEINAESGKIIAHDKDFND